MRFPSLLKVLMAGLGCGLLAAACSAPDPGALTLSDKTPRVGEGQTTSGGSSGTTSGGSSGTSGGSSGASGSSGTSGTSGATDSGPADTGPDTAGPPVPDAFKGAPAYVATQGQSATNGSHGTMDNLPPSHDCFQCHKAGGPGNEMTMGGFIKNAAGNPAAKVEVRVVDGAGNEVAKAYTESNGYFYVLGNALNGGPFKVGVRAAGSATGMVGTITSGGCGAGGTCHGGTQGDLHNP